MSEEEVFHFLKILEIALIGSVKFALAPFEAERQGFNFRESFAISTCGGIVGIIAFTFIGDALKYAWKKIKNSFKRKSKIEGEPKKRFTRSNKLILKVKMKYGLIGLAILTPAVISIPVGSIAINHFYRKKIRNITLLILSLLIWSLVINGIAQYLALSQYLHVE